MASNFGKMTILNGHLHMDLMSLRDLHDLFQLDDIAYGGAYQLPYVHDNCHAYVIGHIGHFCLHWLLDTDLALASWSGVLSI